MGERVEGGDGVGWSEEEVLRWSVMLLSLRARAEKEVGYAKPVALQ